MKKRHVKDLLGFSETWHLFAEGCLRNRHFHEQVFAHGPKCLVCDRSFSKKDGELTSKIEKHHNDYLWTCIGSLLPDDHQDIYRTSFKGEFPKVPDCRQCQIDNPEHFEGCLKRIFPVHAACHEHVHGKEKHLYDGLRSQLKNQFYTAARSWVPVEFYFD